MRYEQTDVLSTSGILFVGLAGCLGQNPFKEQPEGSTDEAEQSGSGATINDAKLQLERYQNHETAIDDGYQNTAACIEGLGILFVKEDVPQISYDTPNMLLYEQSDTNQYELVGAEWFVPASDTDEPPALFAGDDRQTFRGPMEGHYSEQPTHYGLHVWLFTENQNGLFADTNSDITCSD